MTHKRIAILWTIVIIFISQLLHCAYTNQQHHHNKQHTSFGLNGNHQPKVQHHQAAGNYYNEPPIVSEARETYEELLSSSSGGGGSGTFEEETRAPSARERCRELISLTLLSFRDLSPDERASEEIDCANLREQIAAASRQRPKSTAARQQTVEAAQPLPVSSAAAAAQTDLSEFPLAPIYNTSPRNATSSDWFQPKQQQSAYVNQMQQLLIQQHQLRQQQQLQQLQATTTTLAPSTQATTFESLFETTMPPTTTSTTTTTTTTPAPPRIRIGQGRKRAKSIRSSTTTSTTTTTTTTTQKPSTLADYADNGELSTDYYDEYDDQAQQTTTTTTTTTARPQRRNSKKPRRRTTSTSTSPRPSTTTTTLSPGYQPRPDGRIIDYMADPNFPRELKGADLTNYPFYISVPEKIDFECKGRHDGYYTNIDLHCQIYHHCAVGNRYDFLCPNYTLFDQTTFTCRFINTVDCDNSAKHFDRNNALYVEKDEASASSSTTSPPPSASSPPTASVQQPAKLNIQLSQRTGAKLVPQKGSNITDVGRRKRESGPLCSRFSHE